MFFAKKRNFDGLCNNIHCFPKLLHIEFSKSENERNDS